MTSARVSFLPAAVALILATGLAPAPASAQSLLRSSGPMPAAAPTPVAHGAWSLYHVPPPPPPPPASPASRMLHTAIYDPVGDRTIVFGGLDSYQAMDDTWSLSSSGDWTPLATLGTPPSQRRDHTAIYDPVRRRMIVFGGSGFFNTFLNDVHALSLTGTPTWSPLATAGVPPPGRFAHTAIYDPVRDRMIVFGGYTGNFVNDVWQLTLSGTPTWSRILPGGVAPAGRNALFAIYDPVRDRMLFFGGWDGSNFRSDVLALNLSGTPSWSAVATSGTPPSARRHYAAIYDGARDRLVISGGESWAGYHDDTYSLSLGGTPAWSLIAAAGSPPFPRAAHRAVLDPVRERMIVFGGYHISGYRNDTHTLSLPSPQGWSEVAPPPPPGGGGPSPRRDHVGIYDPVRDRMLIFGGWDGTFRNDVWALSLTDPPTWTRILTAGTPPPPRFAHAGIYDDANDRLVVFGGYDGTFRNDVWALSLSGTPAWTQIAPAGAAPAGRNAMTAIRDPVRNRMVLFGGWDGTAFRGDVWALNLTGAPAWTQIVPGGGQQPSARRHYAGVYDPARDDFIVSCGLAFSSATSEGEHVNDTWMLALGGNWSRMGGPTHQVPTARGSLRGIYDAPRDRMIVWGGYDVNYLNDTWALSLGSPRRWTPLTPAGSPPEGRVLHSAVYDPIRDRVIVFGGEGNASTLFDDAWALSFGGAAAAGRPRLEIGAGTPRRDAVSEFALYGVRPNPWSGSDRLTVAFALPGGGPATLEMFTVSGQRVLHREVGGLGGGAHELVVDPAGRLAPGLYMVRLSSHRGSVVSKVAKLR